MKPVEYKDNYLVYPDGRVWLKKSNRFAKLSKHHTGYIQLMINGKTELVHRIVATCFIPNTINKPHINHIDGVKWNNNISNIEWCTRYENMHHSREVLGNKRDTPIRAIHILTGKTYEFQSQKECAIALKNIDRRNINGCLRGKGKTLKGYTFEYITD